MINIRFARIYLLILAVIFFSLGAFTQLYTVRHPLFDVDKALSVAYPNFINIIFFFLGFLSLISVYYAEKNESKILSATNTTLEKEIIPMYYSERGREDIPRDWMARIRESLRTVTPLFSTRRMVKDYVERLYLPAMDK